MFGETYKVSWLKPKEHSFRISALGIGLSVTMSSRDADPKLLFFRIKEFLHRFSGFPPCDGVGSTLKRLAACASLQRSQSKF